MQFVFPMNRFLFKVQHNANLKSFIIYVMG